MTPDIDDLRTFYASRLGLIAQRYIARIVQARWHNCAGLSVLGIGYAPPFLEGFANNALRTMSFMPAEMGVMNGPSSGIGSTALVEAQMLPLPDASIDRLILVHALETSQNPRELLTEIWRVLTPGGRLIVIVPNRRGLWARFDTTPFGNGQPFSRGQLRQILRESLFSPLNQAEALYMPPSDWRLFLRMWPMFESLGHRFTLPGAGVLIVEATKLLYRPIAQKTSVERAVPRVPAALAPHSGRGA